jgi:hypothetical protein
MGLLVAGLLTGHVPAQPGALRVPSALLWLTATLFCSSGLGLMLSRWLPKPAAVCAVLAFCCFLGIFNWIAFGPGEREFTHGKSGSIGTPVSETEGRLVFGLFAGALDALILYGVYRVLRPRKGTGA